MLIGRARVSTHDQNLDLQIDALDGARAGGPRPSTSGGDRGPSPLGKESTASIGAICKTLKISRGALSRHVSGKDARRRTELL